MVPSGMNRLNLLKAESLILCGTKYCGQTLGQLVLLYQQLTCLQEHLVEKGCNVTKWDECLAMKVQGECKHSQVFDSTFFSLLNCHPDFQAYLCI